MVRAFFPLAATYTRLIRTVCHPPWRWYAAKRPWSRFSRRTVRRMRTPSRRPWQSRYGYRWLFNCTALKLMHLIYTHLSFTYPFQGLDTIKTKGESVAMVLALVGAGKVLFHSLNRIQLIEICKMYLRARIEPLKEATGRIVGFQLIPLSVLGRPRIG